MRIHAAKILLLILAGALAIAAPATRAAEEPPLLPLQVFFANARSSWDYRVSPDGTRIAWIALRERRATLHFRRLEETTPRVVETPREVRSPWPGSNTYWWSRDGRRLLFLMDRNGDENTHLYAVDADAAEPVARDLTPLDGVRVEYMRNVRGEPEVVLVRHNGRTHKVFDLYRLNL